jgi:OTU domain-containing protein 6
MAEERSKGGGVIAIAEYGQEYSKGKKPVRVLYHGFGHYDALHLPNEQLNASL